jgi:hypothetical protein
MSALGEPSRYASRPLTPPVAARHRRVGSCSDRQPPPLGPLSSPRGRFHRATRIVPPSPRERSHLPGARRWRNDSRRLPSCRTLCLPPQIHAAFQPRTPDVSRRRTEPVPRAFPVTFEPEAPRTVSRRHRCAPVPSAARVHAPCDALLHRPSRPLSSFLEEERPPSASAVRVVCDGLTCPPATCLAAVRGAPVRCVRPTSASHFRFDYEHSRPIVLPASLRGLRLAPSPRARTLDDGGWGTERFTTPDPLRRAIRVGVRSLPPLAPRLAEPLTPLSPARPPPSLSRRSQRTNRPRPRAACAP